MSRQVLRKSAVLNQHPTWHRLTGILWWVKQCSNHCILVYPCQRLHLGLLVSNMWLFLYPWLSLYHIINSSNSNNNNNRHRHPQAQLQRMLPQAQSLVLLCLSIPHQQHLCQTCIMECQISPHHNHHRLAFPIHKNNLHPQKRITTHNGSHCLFLCFAYSNPISYIPYAMFSVYSFLNWSTRLQIDYYIFWGGCVHWEMWRRGSFDRTTKKVHLQ